MEIRQGKQTQHMPTQESGAINQSQRLEAVSSSEACMMPLCTSHTRTPSLEHTHRCICSATLGTAQISATGAGLISNCALSCPCLLSYGIPALMRPTAAASLTSAWFCSASASVVAAVSTSTLSHSRRSQIRRSLVSWYMSAAARRCCAIGTSSLGPSRSSGSWSVRAHSAHKAAGGHTPAAHTHWQW